MPVIPRSLRLPPPYRGRTIRGLIDRVPTLRACRQWWEEAGRRRLARRGRRSLASGRPEGRRFLAAIPARFCGVGHSATEWNAAFQWAPRLDLEFANVPLGEPWGSLLGLGGSAPLWDEVLQTHRPLVVRLPPVPWGEGIDSCGLIAPVVDAIRSPRNLLFVLADGQNCYDHTADAARLRADFLAFGRWHHLPDHREPGRLNVAVHVRRGDVAAMKARDEGNWRERFMTADWFARAMAMIRDEHRGETPLFHIYSQGSPQEFAELARRFDLRLHLDAGDQESLLNMIRSDVLIMSPSGFSYLAAILGDGRKVARTPWWHHLPQGENWTLLSPETNDASQCPL